MIVRNVVELHVITDAGMIQLVMDDGRTVEIKANLMKTGLDPTNDLVYCWDSSQSQIAVGVDVVEPNYYSLDYNNITDPVEASATDLHDTLLDYMASAGSSVLPADAATATNQLTEIAEIASLKVAGIDVNHKTLYDVWLYTATTANYVQRISDGLATPNQNPYSEEGHATLAAALAAYVTWKNVTSVLITDGFPQFICNGFTGTYGFVVLFR